MTQRLFYCKFICLFSMVWFSVNLQAADATATPTTDKPSIPSSGAKKIRTNSVYNLSHINFEAVSWQENLVLQQAGIDIPLRAQIQGLHLGYQVLLLRPRWRISFEPFFEYLQANTSGETATVFFKQNYVRTYALGFSTMYPISYRRLGTSFYVGGRVRERLMDLQKTDAADQFSDRLKLLVSLELSMSWQIFDRYAFYQVLGFKTSGPPLIWAFGLRRNF